MAVVNRRWFVVAFLIVFPWVVCGFGQTKAPARKGPAVAKNPAVALETTMGTIKIELYQDKAPVTVKNFLDYVNSGFYDGTLIQRVDFVIQGGGYTENWTPKPTRPGIQNESRNGVKNAHYTVSMARYDAPNSATSQFFINLSDNTHLDPPSGGWGYAVFGKVIEGTDVVDKIAKVKTATKSVSGTPFPNVPVQPIVVKSAKVVS